jgi:site-specific recombinase XerD
MLRAGMDLESLRKQLGHHDIESLRHYVDAQKSEALAAKVGSVFGQQELAGMSAAAWRSIFGQ